jgi:hypothetical protein
MFLLNEEREIFGPKGMVNANNTAAIEVCIPDCKKEYHSPIVPNNE